MNLALLPWRVPKSKLKEYHRMFTFFDANNDGHITFHELKMAMNRCGLFPTKLELRVLLGMGDKDGNGVITFDEFLELMRDLDKQSNSSKKEDDVEEIPRPSSAACTGSKVDWTPNRKKSSSLKCRFDFNGRSSSAEDTSNVTMNPLIVAFVAAGKKLSVASKLQQSTDDEQAPLLHHPFSSATPNSNRKGQRDSCWYQSEQRLKDNLSIKTTRDREERLLTEFKLFDKDNDGYIEPNEMEALVDELHLNELFPRNYLMHLFSEADKDKDGRISFEEFATAMA